MSPRDATAMDARDRAAFFYAMEARLTAQVSDRMLDLAGVSPGMRVLDVATGRGEPLLRAARRVGPRGHVLGVDISDTALSATRDEAARAGLGNVELAQRDAETVDEVAQIARGFDVATSRWGLPYMRDPVRVLAAIRRALVPFGVLVAAVWAEPPRIPWWSMPRAATSRFVALPPHDPSGPGAFRLGTREIIERDFSRAGLRVSHVEEMDVRVVEARDAAGIVAWVDAVLGRWVADLPASARPAWEEEIARACEAHREGNLIRVGGVTKLVVARAQ